MSDNKQHDVIAFRRTGRVEKVLPWGWSEDPDGGVDLWVSPSNAKYPTVTPIDPANLVECEGGESGAVERVLARFKVFGGSAQRNLHYVIEARDDNAVASIIRAAITGTPPEPEVPAWAEAFLRERYGDDCAVARHEMAKHYRASQKGE